MKRNILATVGVAALAILTVAGAPIAPIWARSTAAQSPAASTSAPQSLEAMEAAGIKMSFDVASVKLNTSGVPARSNALGSGAAFPTGGLFSATKLRDEGRPGVSARSVEAWKNRAAASTPRRRWSVLDTSRAVPGGRGCGDSGSLRRWH
jgi:hypothetical protein